MKARTAASAMTIAACLSASLAGCSGGSDGLSRTALDAKANSLCAAAGRAIKAVPPPSNPKDATAAAAYLDAVVPIVTRITSGLAALKPAGDVKADWNAFIALQRREDAAFISIQHKADAQDPSGLTDLQQIPALESQINAAATKAGAGGCVD